MQVWNKHNYFPSASELPYTKGWLFWKVVIDELGSCPTDTMTSKVRARFDVFFLRIKSHQYNFTKTHKKQKIECRLSFVFAKMIPMQNELVKFLNLIWYKVWCRYVKKTFKDPIFLFLILKYVQVWNKNNYFPCTSILLCKIDFVYFS